MGSPCSGKEDHEPALFPVSSAQGTAFIDVLLYSALSHFSNGKA
jgi:hypothetical protein